MIQAPYGSSSGGYGGGGGFLWDGTQVNSGANANARLPWITATGEYIDGGPWLVVGASVGASGASVVSTPLFDSVRDNVSLQLWAAPGNAIAAQCLPLTLDPSARDFTTGAWTALIIDSVVNQLSISSPSGLAKLELFWLDKTRRSFVASAASAWSATPALTFTAQTSWANLTPPTAACYVAVRFTWTVDPGAGSIRTATFREPAIGFHSFGVANITGSGSFEPRYV